MSEETPISQQQWQQWLYAGAAKTFSRLKETQRWILSIGAFLACLALGFFLGLAARTRYRKAHPPARIFTTVTQWGRKSLVSGCQSGAESLRRECADSLIGLAGTVGRGQNASI